MIRMRMSAALLATALCACNGEDGNGAPSDEMLAAAQGRWSRCAVGEGPSDQRVAIAISGTNVSGTVTVHEGMDATCAGTVVTTVPLTQTFTLGGTVNVPLGAGTVPAREIDVVQSAGPNIYTLVFVLTAAEPDLLYDGAAAADPDYGGTSPASRPRVLDEANPYVRVP